MENVVIQDADNYGEVLGILTLKDHTKEELTDYMESKDIRRAEDLLIMLTLMDWKFIYTNNVCSLSM
jgi:hypothetical protein